MRQPKLEQPPSLERKTGDYITQVREYKLITPLFGGGVRPKEADPVTVIRGTEIRGHLRFWWRATQGGRFNGDIQAMKTAEDELWGSVSAGKNKTPIPSAIQVQIQLLNSGHPFIVRDRNGNQVDISHWRSDYSYAAFPLESEQTVQEGIQFKVTLVFPGKYKDEIAATLWAWDTFGGIGARTRRGFGSLQCTNVDGQIIHAPECNQVHTYIKDGLSRYVPTGKSPNDLPHLTRNLYYRVTAPQQTSLEAWRKLLYALKKFRQARNSGTQQNRPGRSQWPEPDAIRRLTGRSSQRHSNNPSHIDKFPRAAFGLPIVFQFKDANQGDPDTTVLQGIQSQKERLASPLILRPIACSNDKAVGVALIL